MSYYLLPKNLHNIKSNDINLFYNDNINQNIPMINHSLFSYLNNSKQEIDNHRDVWDTIKKLTNPYEYIHTLVPNFKISISQLKPLSRSFYKLIEIIDTFDLLKSPDKITSFHMAEGPGGFIEATVLRRNNPQDMYYGMTLVDNSDDSIPGWKKSRGFLDENSNVTIETGDDKDGNLFSVNNFRGLIEKFESSFEFITADGGFDFSGDYNSQEIMASKLILVEILHALVLQKLGGTFILKVYDIYHKYSLDCLYILAFFYRDVYIYKPNTSRYANSEKYLICKDMIYTPDNSLKDKFISIISTLDDKPLKKILGYDIPLLFTQNIENLNSIFGEQQLDNIITTLSFVEHFRGKKEKIEQLKKNNLSKCVQWCELHNIPYNKKINYRNIFLE